MLQPLATFPEQFTFSPTLVGTPPSLHTKKALLVGMGGSLISGLLIKDFFPGISLSLHNDYGIPANVSKDTLVICNSYSGDTEEVLDAYEAAMWQGLSIVAISRGGELIKRAQHNSTPYILLPEAKLEPRFAIGHQMLAILSVVDRNACQALKDAGRKLSSKEAEEVGKRISSHLSHKLPIIYGSQKHFAICYSVKAAFNEGAKIPAFANHLSEANHNELEMFSSLTTEQKKSFGVLFFEGENDHPRIRQRIEIMRELFQKNHVYCTSISIESALVSQLQALLAGYYAATYTALVRHVDPYTTPLIKEFKRRLH